MPCRELLPESLQFHDRSPGRRLGMRQNLRELLRHQSPFAPGTGLQLPVRPLGRFLTFRVANRVPPLFLHYGGSLHQMQTLRRVARLTAKCRSRAWLINSCSESGGRRNPLRDALAASHPRVHGRDGPYPRDRHRRGDCDLQRGRHHPAAAAAVARRRSTGEAGRVGPHFRRRTTAASARDQLPGASGLARSRRRPSRSPPPSSPWRNGW